MLRTRGDALPGQTARLPDNQTGRPRTSAIKPEARATFWLSRSPQVGDAIDRAGAVARRRRSKKPMSINSPTTGARHRATDLKPGRFSRSGAVSEEAPAATISARGDASVLLQPHNTSVRWWLDRIRAEGKGTFKVRGKTLAQGQMRMCTEVSNDYRYSNLSYRECTSGAQSAKSLSRKLRINPTGTSKKVKQVTATKIINGDKPLELEE